MSTERTAAEESVWPPLPQVVRSASGPVLVRRVQSLGKRVLGKFSWAKRRIGVIRELEGVAAWQVFFHEWTHMVLADSGLTAELNAKLEERICDAIAAVAVGEMENLLNARSTV